MTDLDRTQDAATVPTDGHAGHQRAFRAIEELRVAETQLARRRQQDSAPSRTTREVLRLVVDAAERGEPITPSELARETQVTNSGMTSVLKKLAGAGLVSFERAARDARSKVVVPTDLARLDDADPLAARIRAVLEDLQPADAHNVAKALERIRREVDKESR